MKGKQGRQGNKQNRRNNQGPRNQTVKVTNQRSVSGGVMSGDNGSRFNRMKGTVRLTDVQIPSVSAGVTDQDAATATGLDYLSLTGTRLAYVFDMFEQWFVHKLSFEWVPTVSLTQAGTIVLACDYDPHDCPPVDNASTVLMNYMGSKSFPLSCKGIVDMPNFKLPSGEWVKPSLFTDILGEPRTHSFGQLLYAVSGATGLTDGDVVGYVNMHYDISFAIPQMGSPTTIKDIAVTQFKQGSNAAIRNIYGDISIDTGTTSGGENLAFHNGTTTVPIEINSLVTGLLKYDDATAGNFFSFSDYMNIVPDGTRIYARPSLTTYNTSSPGFDPPTGDSQYVSQISTSPMFPPWATLAATIGGNAAIKLLGAKLLSKRTIY